MPIVELTSTDIRTRVAAGQSIRYRTPRAVEKYIETNGLYRLARSRQCHERASHRAAATPLADPQHLAHGWRQSSR